MDALNYLIYVPYRLDLHGLFVISGADCSGYFICSETHVFGLF